MSSHDLRGGGSPVCGGSEGIGSLCTVGGGTYADSSTCSSGGGTNASGPLPVAGRPRRCKFNLSCNAYMILNHINNLCNFKIKH